MQERLMICLRTTRIDLPIQHKGATHCQNPVSTINVNAILIRAANTGGARVTLPKALLLDEVASVIWVNEMVNTTPDINNDASLQKRIGKALNRNAQDPIKSEFEDIRELLSQF